MVLVAGWVFLLGGIMVNGEGGKWGKGGAIWDKAIDNFTDPSSKAALNHEGEVRQQKTAA